MKNMNVCTIEVILDGNSEHVAQAIRKIRLFGEEKSICVCSRCNQRPLTDHIT